MEGEVARADQLIAETTLGDPRIQRLMTIPGVGVTTAAALVAVVGDVARFPRPNQLVGYLGLDPRVRRSGNKPAYTGHVSRQGQAHARGLLVEAAHAAVRRPGPLRAFYLRIRARRGSQVALVAVARKLAILTWHLLTKGEDSTGPRRTRPPRSCARWPSRPARRSFPTVAPGSRVPGAAPARTPERPPLWRRFGSGPTRMPSPSRQSRSTARWSLATPGFAWAREPSDVACWMRQARWKEHLLTRLRRRQGIRRRIASLPLADRAP